MVKWVQPGVFTLKKRVLLLIIIILMAAGLILIITTGFNAKKNPVSVSSSSVGATPKQVEQTLNKTKNDLLKNNDYDLYQASQLGLVGQYIVSNDSSDAERVLNNIVKTVPEDKIRPEVYMQLWGIANGKGDKTSAQQYAQKIVDLLKAQENPNQTAIDSWSSKL